MMIAEPMINLVVVAVENLFVRSLFRLKAVSNLRFTLTADFCFHWNIGLEAYVRFTVLDEAIGSLQDSLKRT